MPLRKAAYVDLSIVNLIILFDLLGSLKFNILKRSQLISFFTIPSLFNVKKGSCTSPEISFSGL